MQLARGLVLPSVERYFRVELEGAVSSVPDWSEEPCIFVMNHTAVVGLEAYLLYAILAKLRPDAPPIRTSIWPAFFKIPVLGDFYRAGGCVAMSVDAVADSLRDGHSVLVFPEGVDATDVRDTVGVFHAGFMRAVKAVAAEMDVPVVPLGWSGVDEANPWFVVTHPLVVRLLMKPILPQFEVAIFPRLPFLRPSKVVFVAGEPMRFSAESIDSETKLRAEVARVRERVVELVGAAMRQRSERIRESARERLLHSALRMHNVLWRRRDGR